MSFSKTLISTAAALTLCASATAALAHGAKHSANTEPSPAYSSFPAEKNTYNSNRNEDLSSRDYTRTRAPYPVGAPSVFAIPEMERNQQEANARTTTNVIRADSYDRLAPAADSAVTTRSRTTTTRY